MQAVLSLFLDLLSSAPKLRTSLASPLPSFEYSHGSYTDVPFLDSTSAAQLPPGYPALSSTSSLLPVDLNSWHSETLFSGHGTSVGSVVLNPHVLTMQGMGRRRKKALEEGGQKKKKEEGSGSVMISFNIDAELQSRLPQCLPRRLEILYHRL
nr:uncharacterized protein LOC129385153 [Dermacentor andersoni]